MDRDLVSQKIVGVDELAQAQREASTADTAAQPVPKVLQPDDPLIQVVPPRREPKMLSAPGRTRTCATGSGGRCSIR